MSTILNSIYCTIKKILGITTDTADKTESILNIVTGLQDNAIILKDTFNNPL